MGFIELIGWLTLILGGGYFFLVYKTNEIDANNQIDKLIEHNDKCQDLIRERNRLVMSNKPTITHIELKKKLHEILNDPKEKQQSLQKIKSKKEFHEELNQINRNRRKCGYKYEIEIFEIFNTNREISFQDLISSIEFKFNVNNFQANELFDIWNENKLIEICQWNKNNWQVGKTLTCEFSNIDQTDLTRDKWINQRGKTLKPESIEYKTYMYGIPAENQRQDVDNNLQEANLLNKQGNEKFSAGEYKEAIAFFNTAIKLQPKVDVFYHNRADCFLKKKQLEKAKTDYQKVISLEPTRNDRNIYSKLASIYMYEENFETALFFYNRAIQISPERKKTLYNRAVAHIKLEDNHSAIEDIKKLIEAEPNNIDCHILLCKLFLEEHNLTEAKKCIDVINIREVMEPDFIVDESQLMKIGGLKLQYYELQSKNETNNLPF